VIRSHVLDGRVVEFGPQRARMTAGLSALVRDLGLEREVVRAPEGLPLYVYADGALRRVGFSARSLLTGDLLTARGKLRLLLEPLTGGARTDERVDALLTRKLGRQAYERVAGPLYGGLTGSDPADMVVGLSLGPLLDELGVGRSFLVSLLARGRTSPPAACSFREGLQSLTDALHARNAAFVRLGTPAREIRRSGSAWAIGLDQGELEAETVVLTCEAPAAARLLAAVAPEAAARIGRLAYNPIAVVPLHAPRAGLRGLGYQVALGEDLETRGVTWNESLFGREGIHTAFLGGARNPRLVVEDDEALGRIAVAEFRRVTGREARALGAAWTAMPAWDASWRSLEGLELPAGIRIAGNWCGRPGIEGRLAEARRVSLHLGR
jgi:oxygen-dependent protoporphyrinogen oxidase